MAESNGQERSLPATQRRLEKAREEGQVARSTELATALLLGTAGLAFSWGGPAFVDGFKRVLGSGLRLGTREAFDSELMFQRLVELSIEGFLAAAPLLGALTVAAFLAPMLLGGWNISWKAVRIDFERFTPLTTLGRMFSTHGLSELAKALAKAVLLGGVLAILLWKSGGAASMLAAMAPESALPRLGDTLLTTFMTLVGALVLIAAIDVPLQLWRHHSGLRMTLEEVREESRESEGDPHVKSRIRGLQRDMARKRMMSAVPKADVVVTNPTHYSVALSYQEGRMRAPRVVAKGAGDVALRIREIAREHRVPTLEAPPLARALHRHAEIGDEIPAALYTAVAQVLAYVYGLKRALAGEADRPGPIEFVTLPEGMDPGVVE